MVNKIFKFMTILFLIILAVYSVKKKKKEFSTAPMLAERPLLVSVYKTKIREIKNFREYLALVEPIKEAKVSTRINATVEKIYVDEGSKIKKGALLAKLDKRDISAKLNSARESLAAAEENFRYWQKEYKRDENLFGQGAISEDERDRAKNSFAQARARLGSAKQNIKFSQANLKYTRITSPYQGVVSRRFVDPGDLAVVGKPLFTVEDRSKLKFSFDIPQPDTKLLKKKQILFYKTNGKMKQTRITNIFPSMGKGRMLHLEAYLNRNEKVLVGSFIPVKVLVAQKKGVVIPKSSLCQMENQNPFVFLVKKNKLKKFPVDIGLRSDEFIAAKNLKAGEIVVKNPYLSWTKLAEGEVVKIMSGGAK